MVYYKDRGTALLYGVEEIVGGHYGQTYGLMNTLMNERKLFREMIC